MKFVQVSSPVVGKIEGRSLGYGLISEIPRAGIAYYLTLADGSLHEVSIYEYEQYGVGDSYDYTAIKPNHFEVFLMVVAAVASFAIILVFLF
jgi:hypothetical protein